MMMEGVKDCFDKCWAENGVGGVIGDSIRRLISENEGLGVII